MRDHHQRDRDFNPQTTPQSKITRRVLTHPRIVHEADFTCKVLVLALKDEILVSRRFNQEHNVRGNLDEVAMPAGTLSQILPSDVPLHGGDDIEIWRLRSAHSPDTQSLQVSRDMRNFEEHTLPDGTTVSLPTVAPNHICVVAAKYDICPDGPPRPLDPGELPPPGFIPPADGRQVKLSIIDTGYIAGNPAFAGRMPASVRGLYHDSAAQAWLQSEPDVLDADGDQKLDGVAGHGTFIAGLVAHRSVHADITVVGHRHQVLPVDNALLQIDQAKFFTSEIAIAVSLLTESLRSQVISCGFAFPTLDAHWSPVLSLALGSLRRHTPAIVAPAGNESSPCAFWPAAHPRVVGVGASNEAQTAPADFSNFGPGADCWARGENVLSTFVSTPFPAECAAVPAARKFDGWARWNGTSFAAPKVAAAIVDVMVETELDPVPAAAKLLADAPQSDPAFVALDGTPLPTLDLG